MNGRAHWLCLAGLLAGCGSDPKSPAPPTPMRGDVVADTRQAKADTDHAFDLIGQGKLDEAKILLDRAIVADTMYGPAHNDLGLIYFAQGNSYAAAWSFERAAKLMPKRGEPQNNLGLVYESAGRWPDAEAAYQAAVDVDPQMIEFVGNLARVRVSRDELDDRTRDLLRQIVLQDRRPAWTAWARAKLVRLPATLPADAPPNGADAGRP